MKPDEEIPFFKLSGEKQEAVKKTINDARAHLGLEFIFDDNECRKLLLAFNAPIQFPIEKIKGGGGTLVTGQSPDGKKTFVAAYWADNPLAHDNGLALAVIDRHKMLASMANVSPDTALKAFGMLWMAIAYTFGFDAVERLKTGGKFWDTSDFMS